LPIKVIEEILEKIDYNSVILNRSKQVLEWFLILRKKIYV